MGPIADYFNVADGQIAIVRFLEQGEDLAYASVHRVPVANRQYPADYLCLDQNDDGTPCPFCLSEDKDVRGRRTQGYINLIWRGSEVFQQYNVQIQQRNIQVMQQGQQPSMLYTLAPVFKRGQNGIPEKGPDKKKIVVGYGDGIFLWKCSNTVYQQLVQKDQVFHGLMSRDFTVRRIGSGMQDTVYFVEPFDANSGEVPMSAADMALANAKYDLDKFITPMSQQEAQATLGGGAGQSYQQPGGQFVRGAGVPVAAMMTPSPQALPPVVQQLSQTPAPPPGQNPFLPSSVPPMPQPPVIG